MSQQAVAALKQMSSTFVSNVVRFPQTISCKWSLKIFYLIVFCMSCFRLFRWSNNNRTLSENQL